MKEIGSFFFVLVIYGGGIEGGISEIVREFSKEYLLYLFEGLKLLGNLVLYFMSMYFDEFWVLKMMGSYEYVILLYGYVEED